MVTFLPIALFGDDFASPKACLHCELPIDKVLLNTENSMKPNQSIAFFETMNLSLGKSSSLLLDFGYVALDLSCRSCVP
jgi:hypothetical protein